MRKSDLILLSGDPTPFGGKAKAKKVIESIRMYQSTILVIAENGERKSVDKYLEDENINIHDHIV